MKNIYLNTGTINEVFNEIETAYNGVLNSNNDEFNLALNTDLIKGNIDGVTFINGVTSIQVNISFSDDVQLSIESLSKSSILFAYCTEGYIKHSFGISGHKSTLKKHQTGIVSGSRSVNTILHFKKNMPIKFSFIKVETESLMNATNDPLISKLKKTFLSKQQNDPTVGIQNIKIAEKFNQFNAITEQGMLGHIMKKDIIQSILTMEIDDHTDNLIKMARTVKLLTLSKISELQKISRSIKQYAYDSISNKVGLSKNEIIVK